VKAVKPTFELLSGDASIRALLVPSENSPAAEPGAIPQGSGSIVEGVPIVRVPIQNGYGVAVWESVSGEPAPPNTIDDVIFGAIVAARSGEAALGTMTIEGCFAPTSTVTVASATDPIPRFADTSRAIAAISFEA